LFNLVLSEPNSLAQEAVAAATGLASSADFGGRRTPYTAHSPSGGDYSSMAGYGCDYGLIYRIYPNSYIRKRLWVKFFSKNLNSRPGSYYGNPQNQQNQLPQGLQQFNGMNGRGMRGFGGRGRGHGGGGRRHGGFRRRRGNWYHFILQKRFLINFC